MRIRFRIVSDKCGQPAPGWRNHAQMDMVRHKADTDDTDGVPPRISADECKTNQVITEGIENENSIERVLVTMDQYPRRTFACSSFHSFKF